MKIVERENIDLNRWDNLVTSKSSSFFSYSWYLDATAENWSILTDDEYTFGVALPFAVRLGIETLYTPIFVRYLEWMGDNSQQLKAKFLITDRFKEINIAFSKPILGENYSEYVFQQIDKSSTMELKSQAKRSLAKAEKAGLVIKEQLDFQDVLKVIDYQLKDKFDGINVNSLRTLEKLILAAKQSNHLKVFEVFSDSCNGGIVCLEDSDNLLYLKGAVDDSTKKQGGMYLAMNTAIKYALENGLDFDFGGSRIKGVRSFNYNLGGKDSVYYGYRINNGPKWFKFAKRLKNKWIKK